METFMETFRLGRIHDGMMVEDNGGGIGAFGR
jgi:hypothetical protein